MEKWKVTALRKGDRKGVEVLERKSWRVKVGESGYK
jgi:hypothetical protein